MVAAVRLPPKADLPQARLADSLRNKTHPKGCRHLYFFTILLTKFIKLRGNSV
jgi:hypothetical protein